MFRTEHSIWVEKYRPQTFEDYLGNEHLIEKLNLYLKDNDIPHLLLNGIQGVGKCLDFSEEINIKIELTDEEYKRLKKYEIK